jgi:hypothetical protein
VHDAIRLWLEPSLVLDGSKSFEPDGAPESFYILAPHDSAKPVFIF